MCVSLVRLLSPATLDRFYLSSLSGPSTPHVSLSLSSPSITPPAASLSIAASLSTGSPVAQHGIVASRWKNAAGKVVQAYSRTHSESFAATQTLADVIATHTNGQGLILSASASEQLAQAFAVNKPLADAHGAAWSNHYCLALTHSATTFSSLSANHAPALDFQISSLEKQMASSATSVLNNLGASIQATLADHIVSVSYSPSKVAETAQFDLRQKADAAFFAEMQYALDLPSKLKSVSALQSLLSDAHQDLIVFSFSSFTGLLEAYGRESEQYRAALVLLNQLFPLLSSEYAGLFADQPAAAMQTLVLLGSHATVLEKQDPRQVEAILKADQVNLSVDVGEGRVDGCTNESEREAAISRCTHRVRASARSLSLTLVVVAWCVCRSVLSATSSLRSMSSRPRWPLSALV